MRTPFEEALLGVIILIAIGCIAITSLIWLLVWWLLG